MLPLAFLTMTILDTQGVGPDTGVTIWRDSNRSNSSLSAVLWANGTFLGGCTTGLALGLMWRWYGSLSFPVPWNTFWNWSIGWSIHEGSLWGLEAGNRIFLNRTWIRSTRRGSLALLEPKIPYSMACQSWGYAARGYIGLPVLVSSDCTWISPVQFPWSFTEPEELLSVPSEMTLQKAPLSNWNRTVFFRISFRYHHSLCDLHHYH